MRLYQSIYETALRNQIPRHVIESLIRIYSYDIDFQHKAQPGDSFDVLFTADATGAIRSWSAEAKTSTHSGLHHSWTFLVRSTTRSGCRAARLLFSVGSLIRS